MLYDSIDDDNVAERILAFATKENIRNLFNSKTWFVDSTFSTAPTIFLQIFAILGVVTQRDSKGEANDIALPYVYALLERKGETSYTQVLSVVMEEARRLGLQNKPDVVMTNFEVAIINSIQMQ